jgi:TP901 family phage tail tape measure protein
MADNNGIGIQLDFVLESQNSVQSKITNLVGKLKNEKFLLDIGFKDSNFMQQFNEINSLIEKTGINMKSSMTGMNLADLQRAVTLTQQLGAGSAFKNQNNFGTSDGIWSNVIQQEKDMNKLISLYEEAEYKVKAIKPVGFVDETQKGDLKQITLELEKQKGIIEKLTYERPTNQSPFMLKSISSVDNTEKLAQEQQKAQEKVVANEKQYQKEVENTISLMMKKVELMDKNNVLPKGNINSLQDKVSGLSIKSDESEFENINAQLTRSLALENELIEKERQRVIQEKVVAQEVAKVNELKQLRSKSVNMADDYKAKTDIALNNLSNKYGSNVPTQQLEEFKKKLLEIQTMGGRVKSVKDFEDLKRAIQEARISYAELDSQTRQNAGGFFSTMSSNIGKFLQYFVGAGGVLYAFNALKEGVRTVVEIESALTDLNKVVDMTGKQMDMMVDSSLKLGQALGQSGKDVMASMAEFGRVNKNLDEIQGLAKTAVMASNVTDMSAAESAKALNTTMIDFKINAKDSMNILNSWNQIQNNYRTSAMDMADSIGAVGVMAKQTGMTLDQLNGITTALVSATGQSGNTAGVAIKTILARTYKLGEEGKDSDVEEVLGKYNIAVRDAQGNLIPFMTILGQLDEKFKTLTQSQKMEIEQSMAGVHHFSQMASLLDNYKVAIDATNSSINSQGSAEQENAKYLQTTEAQYKQLQVAMEKLALSTFDTGMFKNVLNGAEGLVNGLTKIIDTFGSLPVAIGTAMVAMKLFNKELTFDATTQSIRKLMDSLSSTPSLIRNVTTGGIQGFNLFGKAINFAEISANALKVGMVALNGAITMGLGMALGWAVEKIYNFVDGLINADEKAKEFNKTITQSNTDGLKSVAEATDLLAKAEQKQNEINKSSSTDEINTKKKELLEIQKELAGVLPQSASGFDEEGNAIASNTDLVREQLQLKKESLSLDAKKWMDENKDDVKNIEYKVAKYKEMKEEYEKLKLLQAQGKDTYEVEVTTEYEGQKSTQKVKKNVTDEMEKYNKEMQKTADLVSQYNINSGILNKYQATLTDGTTKVYQSFNLETKAIQEANNAIQQQPKSQAYEGFRQQVDDATNRINELKKAQTDVSANGINQDNLQPILTMYPELLSKMGDQKGLQEAINKKIAEQETVSKTAYSNMMQHSSDAYGQIQKSAQDMAEDFEKYRKTTQEAVEKLTELKDIQKDLQKDGMSASSLKDVVKTYPELLAYMNDQQGLQNKINEMIKKQEEVARQAYVNMLKNNAEMYNKELQNAQTYYEAKLRYNNDFQMAVNNLIKNYVGNNASGYEIDLRNFKSLNEAKAEVLRRMDQAIGNSNNNMLQQIGQLNAGYGNVAEVQKAYDAMKALEAKQKQMGVDFDDLSIQFGSVPTTIDTASNISGVGNDKADKEQRVADILKLEIDRYLNINGQLRDIEGAITRINTLKETTNDAWTYVNALQEEMGLLRQKKAVLQELYNEQKREYDELFPKLMGNGFNIQGNLITNFRERINQITAEANQLASAQDDAGKKEFDRRKARAEDLKTSVERFMDLSHNAMQSTISDIQSIEKEIQSIQKSRIESVQSVEQKYNEIYKKMVDERINAINKEKDARIKAIDEAQKKYQESTAEDDYNKNLNTKQQALLQLQNQIKNAQRDTSLQGQAKLQSYLNEAKNMQKEIDDLVLNRQRELNNQMFENQKNNVSDKAEKQIEQLQNTFSDKNIAKIVAESMKTGIIRDIDGQMKSLKDLYVNWANEFSDGLSSVGEYLKSDFILKLEEAVDNAKSLQNIFNELGVKRTGVIDTGSFSTAVKDYIGQIDVKSILPNISSNLVLPTTVTNGVRTVNPTGANVEIRFDKLINVEGDISSLDSNVIQKMTEIATTIVKKASTEVKNELSKLGVLSPV